MSVIESVKNILLVTSCVSNVIMVGVFWYVVLSTLTDLFLVNTPTDVDIDEKTR